MLSSRKDKMLEKMINFRLPNWFLFAGIFVNTWLVCFSLIMGDKISVLLGILCVGFFIFTYKLNQRERNEQEDEKRKND